MRSLIFSALILATGPVPQQPGPGILSGRVTTVEGGPVAGIRVVALETAYPRLNIASQTQTDADGRYRLVNVPAGVYFVVADPFNIPSYYPGTGNRDDSRPVEVGPGATVAALDFKRVRSSGLLRTVRTPSPGASRYSGVLRNTSGKGLPNTVLALTNSATQARRWTVTDASGAFAFPGLSAGAYSLDTLSPIDKGHEDLTLAITLDAAENLDQEIGVRGLGNWEQRPDLYAQSDPQERRESLQASGPGTPTFWRCQRIDQQPPAEYSQSARSANRTGSVALRVRVDEAGMLVWLRAVSVEGDAEFTRAAVEAFGHWRFKPIRWTRDSFDRLRIASCETGDETLAFQGTITFTFPPGSASF